jgi:hypothetical protein
MKIGAGSKKHITDSGSCLMAGSRVNGIESSRSVIILLTEKVYCYVLTEINYLFTISKGMIHFQNNLMRQ